MELQVEARAVLVHRKASSACCGAPLALAAEGVPHEFDCTQCSGPAERVFGEPVTVEAHG